MKTKTKSRMGASRPFYIPLLMLLFAGLACQTVAQPPTATFTATATATPKIGGRVFGVECQPDTLKMIHGETKEIALADTQGVGKVTAFKVSSVTGTTADSDASEIEVSQKPDAGGSGWSSLPGSIQIKSTAVDPPVRSEEYLLNILLGGSQGDQIAGGNLWCLVIVEHTEKATDTPTPTSTLPQQPQPTNTETPKPKVVITDGGLHVTYLGPVEVKTGGTLAASFQITGPDGKPASGTLLASLGDPPSDPRATHGEGELDAEGKVTISLAVNWPAGETKLYVSWNGKVYEVSGINITP